MVLMTIDNRCQRFELWNLFWWHSLEFPKKKHTNHSVWSSILYGVWKIKNLIKHHLNKWHNRRACRWLMIRDSFLVRLTKKSHWFILAHFYRVVNFFPPKQMEKQNYKRMISDIDWLWFEFFEVVTSDQSK